MSKLILYHGSPEIVQTPLFGKGKSYNDYGKGFYSTEHLELAKEWAVCRPNDNNGWVHKYELDTTDLKILDFQEKNVLSWLAELMKHRDAADSKRYRILAKQFIEKYGVDTSEYDVIKGETQFTEILKETIGYEVDWSYKDATIEEGVVCPHLVDIQTPLTEILLDVSGSVDDELLKSFLRECKNIMKTSKLKIGCFDTVFYGFIDIHDENEIDRLSFPGGGGTDFEVAINAFSRRADNKIIFTDGKGSMPYSNDIIWMIYNNQVDDIKGRKIIHVSELKSINKPFIVILNINESLMFSIHTGQKNSNCFL